MILRRAFLCLVGGALLLSACQSGPGGDALHTAGRQCDLERIEELLDDGTDPNGYDSFGMTPMASTAGSGIQCLDGLQLLFDAGGDPGQLSQRGDSTFVALANAPYRPGNGTLETASWLLGHGADPCVPVSGFHEVVTGDETLVEIATSAGNTELVEFLVDTMVQCP